MNKLYLKAPTFNTKEEVWSGKDSYFLKRKATKLINFIDEIDPPVADMGEINPMIQLLEKGLNFNAHSIQNIDFDYDTIDGKYKTILCLDVVEHLFNPLFALENMKKALLHDGTIYISTPRRPCFLWTRYHFHEFDNKRIRWLFSRAGLEIVKYERHYLHDHWYKHLKGVRPIIRYFLKSWQLYKLKINILLVTVLCPVMLF